MIAGRRGPSTYPRLVADRNASTLGSTLNATGTDFGDSVDALGRNDSCTTDTESTCKVHEGRSN